MIPQWVLQDYRHSCKSTEWPTVYNRHLEELISVYEKQHSNSHISKGYLAWSGCAYVYHPEPGETVYRSIEHCIEHAKEKGCHIILNHNERRMYVFPDDTVSGARERFLKMFPEGR